MLKEVGGDTTGTPDPSWLKRYSILYDVVLSNKIWEKEEGEVFKVM